MQNEGFSETRSYRVRLLTDSPIQTWLKPQNLDAKPNTRVLCIAFCRRSIIHPEVFLPLLLISADGLSQYSIPNHQKLYHIRELFCYGYL